MLQSSAVIVAVSQDEILTGEAVALDVQPLGFVLRALGTLIDVVAIFILIAGLFLVADFLFYPGLDDSVTPIVTIVILVLAQVITPTIVETATHGRSLGKLAVGGRIVRSDGGAAGFRHTFIRAMLGLLEIWITLGGIAAITGALSPRSQRLGDLAAGTYCQRVRTPRLEVTVAAIPPQLTQWAGTADVARLPDRLARRVAQFVKNSPAMEPHSARRISSALMSEVAAYVAPLPAAPPDMVLHAVAVVRRERELRALQLEDQRVAALLRGSSS